MWFNCKAKNRRLGREYVLDVKLRSSQARAARTRLVAVALSVVSATLLGLYLLWRGGEWVLNQLVYENKAFAIQEIDMQTDGVVAVDQLRRWTGVKVGDNLFALDLARVQRNLELVPLIQSASIACIPPHTLRIRVSEREPVAQVNIPRPKASGGVELGAFYLDAEGYVMLPLDARQRATPPSQPPEMFPTISGLNGTDLQAGRRIESPPVQAALQLIAAFEHSPLRGLVDLRRIDVSAAEVMVVTTGQGTEVTFGLNNLDKQLRRWQAIFEAAQKLNKGVAALDLSVSDNIPARCLDASALPPTGTAKPPKPYKKKHV